MKLIDISGPIYTGMWNYTEPLGSLLGDFNLSSLHVERGAEQYIVELFENMKAQTGTYLESPGRYLPDNAYTVSDIPVERLYMMDAYVLFMPHDELNMQDGKRFVSLQDIKRAEEFPIPEGSAVLVGTGYGANWEREDFFSRSWFFKRDAMEYLIERKPFLLGTDSAEWENGANPEGIFSLFFPANILILASCINLEKVKTFHVKLTLLPLKVLSAFICPVRAVVSC